MADNPETRQNYQTGLDIPDIYFKIVNSDRIMQFTFRANIDKIREVCVASQEILRQWLIPENTCYEIVLAIDEALTNIFEHGYGASNKANDNSVRLEILNNNHEITIIIEDNAPSYELASPDHLDRHKYLFSDAIGGFGVAIIRKMMDSVKLIRKSTTNILEMIKKIPVIPQNGSVIISTDTSEARIYNNILMVKTKPGAVIDLTQAKINVWAYEDIINRYPQYMVYAKIIDQTEVKSISLDARKYYINHEAEHIKAIALVRKSSIERMLVNLLSFFSKSKRAVSMFHNETEALKWIEKFSHHVKQAV